MKYSQMLGTYEIKDKPTMLNIDGIEIKLNVIHNNDNISYDTNKQ